LKDHNIDFPEEPSEGSPKRLNGLDNGRRYLPYA